MYTAFYRVYPPSATLVLAMQEDGKDGLQPVPSMLALPSFRTAPSSASTGSGVSVDISSDEDEAPCAGSSAGSVSSGRPAKKAKPESPNNQAASPAKALQALPVEAGSMNPAWKSKEQIQELFPGDLQTVDLLVERKTAEQQFKDLVVQGVAVRVYWMPFVGRSPPTASKSRSPGTQPVKVETKAPAVLLASSTPEQAPAKPFSPPPKSNTAKATAPTVTFAGSFPAQAFAKPSSNSPPSKSIMKKSASTASLEDTQMDSPPPPLYSPATRADVQQFFAAHPGAMVTPEKQATGCYATMPATSPKKMHGSGHRPIPTPSRAPGFTEAKQEIKAEVLQAAPVHPEPAVAASVPPQGLAPVESKIPVLPADSQAMALALPKGPAPADPKIPVVFADSQATALALLKGPAPADPKIPVVPADLQAMALALPKGLAPADPKIPVVPADSRAMALALPKGPAPADPKIPVVPADLQAMALALPKGPAPKIPVVPADSRAMALALPKGPAPADPEIPVSPADPQALALPKGPPAVPPASTVTLPKAPPAKAVALQGPPPAPSPRAAGMVPMAPSPAKAAGRALMPQIAPGASRFNIHFYHIQ